MYYDIVTTSYGNLLCAHDLRHIYFAGLVDIENGKTENIVLFEAVIQLSEKIVKQKKLPQSWVKLIQEERYIEVPIKLKGTLFQKEVWLTLRSIPYGFTVSYSGLANTLCKPNAVRAIASAIAKNPISLIVPCHRVISKTGATHKYRWGESKKEELISKEHKILLNKAA